MGLWVELLVMVVLVFRAISSSDDIIALVVVVLVVVECTCRPASSAPGCPVAGREGYKRRFLL